MAMACEKPEQYGRPITRWTHRKLIDEVIKQKVVKSISPSQVGRFLRKADLQPHRNQYWLNAKPDEKKEERINDICQCYENASQNNNELTISVDEMTGIQALERISSDLPMSPGKPVALEFEYERHGTQSFFAGLIEVWFGILMKKVIKRGQFLSTEDLKNKILKFVDYFNGNMAKPFKWTYQGKALQA